MTLRLTSDPRLKVSDDLHSLLEDGELSLRAVAAGVACVTLRLTSDPRLKVSDDLHGLLQHGEFSLRAVTHL